MRKKEFIEKGFAIERMLAKHLYIEEEWIKSVKISQDGIEVEYDDHNEEE
jgi:hypothetical protein